MSSMSLGHSIVTSAATARWWQKGVCTIMPAVLSKCIAIASNGLFVFFFFVGSSSRYFSIHIGVSCRHLRSNFQSILQYTFLSYDSYSLYIDILRYRMQTQLRRNNLFIYRSILILNPFSLSCLRFSLYLIVSSFRLSNYYFLIYLRLDKCLLF